MTIEELMNKLGLTEVSKVDRQLLDHLLHLYNTGQLKVVSISREEALLQMADAYLHLFVQMQSLRPLLTASLKKVSFSFFLLFLITNDKDNAFPLKYTLWSAK